MAFALSTRVTGPRPREAAKSKAARTIRSTPFRVFTSSWIATSSGVPSLKVPPIPTYTPSVFSRKTWSSISRSSAPFSGQWAGSRSTHGR